MSDLTTTQIFAAAEKNITATKMNNIIGGATIQPDFYANKPTASSVNPTDQLLILSGGAYAQAPFSTIVNSVGSSMGPQITAVRLRSFNAIGNPTFEVDQKNVGASIGWAAAGAGLDRWPTFKVGSLSGVVQQIAASPPILVPGTSFAITSSFLRMTLLTAQASLGTSDAIQLGIKPEGPRLRELISDVHSIELLVRSSVASLKFAVTLRDTGLVRSLAKLCTIPSANTWTLIQLPNLPVWDSGGTWLLTPGNQGYYLNIQLAAGSSLIAPAVDTWQNGNFQGAPGMSNFANNPVNSTFDIAFIQHEPGAQCTTPIDCPWQQNYDDCLRYFCKSYDYDVVIGSASAQAGMIGLIPISTTGGEGAIRYPKAMAKLPTLTGYNPVTGAANSLRHSNGSDFAITAFSNSSKSGFESIGTATLPTVAVGQSLRFHYVADTGW